MSNKQIVLDKIVGDFVDNIVEFLHVQNYMCLFLNRN